MRADVLHKVCLETSLFDGHCHNPQHFSGQQEQFLQIFTESSVATPRERSMVRSTVAYQRGLRILCETFSVTPATEEAFLAFRRTFPNVEALTALCLERGNYAAIAVDEFGANAVPFRQMWSDARRVIRSEQFLERLLIHKWATQNVTPNCTVCGSEELPTDAKTCSLCHEVACATCFSAQTGTCIVCFQESRQVADVARVKLISAFVKFERRYIAFLSKELSDDRTVALKTIVAYRSTTGLQCASPTREEAMTAFYALGSGLQEQLKNAGGEAPKLRLTDRSLIWHFLRLASSVAAERNIPLQVHTGFGDADLELHLSDPSLLTPFVRWAAALKPNPLKIVLLHCSYPYARSAGYMCSVYENVYSDLGLAIPLLSTPGMRESVGALLELSPTKKLTFSSDCNTSPEAFVLASQLGRNVLFYVLDQLRTCGDLTEDQCIEAAKDILFRNAERLYSRAKQEDEDADANGKK